MYRIYFLWLIMLIITSCEKEVITIIHEPEKVKVDSLKPSSFELFVDEVTDTRIKIHWNQSVDETTGVTYEILVGDSVIAFGSYSRREYSIENLIPETEYTISVMALDQERNSFISTTKATTKKPFYNKILTFNTDYYFYRFNNVISTDDGGLLICGRYLENQYSGYVTFLVRLDEEYNVIWYKENNFEIVDIRKITSDCFLITGSEFVSKIDGNGNEIWKCQVELVAGELATALENNSGEVIIIGTWWSIPEVTVKYYIGKISETGTLLWQKNGGSTRSNFFTDIVQKADGGYLVLGTHQATYDFGGWIRSAWLVETDEEGNITRETDYLSEFKDDDQPSCIIKWIGGNYLLAGSTAGCLPPYYHVNIIPRFILVSPEGNIIWDKTHSIVFGTDEYFRSYAVEEDNSILFLSSTYEHSAFAWFGQNGDISNKLVLNDLPQSIFLKKNSFGNYVLALSDGFIIVINKDGYREP